jgi:Leucine-rich repeat (LRR) protein
MPSLLSLELHGNGLSGELPVELYDASKLQLLNVAMQFQWSNECYMSNGTYVNTLFERGGVYSRNINQGLSGQVLAPKVNKWASMKGLHLFDNSFSGTISDEIGDLKYLVFLRAQNNYFFGFLPNLLASLKQLREVYLNKNEIQLDIPANIGDMEDLEDLRLNENEMTGIIPDSLYTLRKLKMLWLHDTLHCEVVGETALNPDGELECGVDSDYGFKGTISTEIGNLKKLSHVLLNNNPLNGTIPTEIGLCEDLAVLHIHKTNIEGSAPMELCLLRDKNLNNELNAGVFYADCRPNNKTQEPFFACDCCSDCCDHTTKVCIADD